MLSGYMKRSKKTGLLPGSLVYIGMSYTEKSKITLIRYNETIYSEEKISYPASLGAQKRI
jgi:hypothetical protein